MARLCAVWSPAAGGDAESGTGLSFLDDGGAGADVASALRTSRAPHGGVLPYVQIYREVGRSVY